MKGALRLSMISILSQNGAYYPCGNLLWVNRQGLRYRARMAERHPAVVVLGKRIREVRREKGFAQEAFAYAAGLDRSYYGAIERGERNVSALNLMRIAAALGVEVGELFPKAEVFGTLLDRAAAAADEE